MADLSLERPQTTVIEQRPHAPINWGRIIVYILLGFGAFLALLPFIWMVNWSFMSAVEVYTGQFIPRNLNIGNYGFAWGTRQLCANHVEQRAHQRYHSCWFAAVLRSCRRALPPHEICVGRDVLFAIMLTTLMIPDIVTLIPNFLTVVWISRLMQIGVWAARCVDG